MSGSGWWACGLACAKAHDVRHRAKRITQAEREGQGGTANSRRLAYTHDNFADVGAALQVSERLADLLEGKDAVDDRFEAVQ